MSRNLGYLALRVTRTIEKMYLMRAWEESDEVDGIQIAVVVSAALRESLTR